MARGTGTVLAPALAAMLAVLLGALTPTQGQAGEAGQQNSSIWSDIERDADKSARDEADPAPPPEPPSLSTARWVGFTPALVVEESAGAEDGAWIAGPFPEAGATGWVSDTVTGLTTEVRLVWREATRGSLAELSAEAGRALGLAPGAVTNVAIYLAR